MITVDVSTNKMDVQRSSFCGARSLSLAGPGLGAGRLAVSDRFFASGRVLMHRRARAQSSVSDAVTTCVTAHLNFRSLGLLAAAASSLFPAVGNTPRLSPKLPKMPKESRTVSLLKERLAAQKALSRTTVGNELLKIQKAELELSVQLKEEVAAKRKAAAAKAAADQAKKDQAKKDQAKKNKGGN